MPNINERYLTLGNPSTVNDLHIAEVHEDYPQQQRGTAVPLLIEDLQYLAVATNERLRDTAGIVKWERKALIQQILLSVNWADEFVSAAGLSDEKFMTMRCLQYMLEGRRGSILIESLESEQMVNVEDDDLTQVPFAKARDLADLRRMAKERKLNGIISRCEHTLKQWERGEGAINNVQLKIQP